MFKCIVMPDNSSYCQYYNFNNSRGVYRGLAGETGAKETTGET